MNEIKECESWLEEDYRSMIPHDLRERKYPQPPPDLEQCHLQQPGAERDNNNKVINRNLATREAGAEDYNML